MTSTIIFCLCLFVAIWFTVLVCVRVCYKQKLNLHFVILAMAWTGVVTHLMHIW